MRDMGDFHLDIDGVAPMIFLKNENDQPIRINFAEPFDNAKDTFFFLVDLFFKGIYYLTIGHYGNCETVRMSEMTLRTVFKAIRKMKNVNVEVLLKANDDESFEPEKVRYILKTSISAAKAMPDNLPLRSYVIMIPINETVYDLRFDFAAYF